MFSTHSLPTTMRRSALAAMLAVSAMLTGCASQYVDTATKEIPVAQFKKPAQPKPVQLSFQFQSDGAPNGRATDFLKEAVSTQIKESGLFVIDSSAASGGALLNVVLNNVPITKDAAAQGFVTGLTFGLAGSAVTDGYVCQVSYLGAGQASPVTASARHAIHTTLGNASAPAGAEKAANGEAAVRTMTRQILSNALNELSTNPAF